MKQHLKRLGEHVIVATLSMFITLLVWTYINSPEEKQSKSFVPFEAIEAIQMPTQIRVGDDLFIRTSAPQNRRKNNEVMDTYTYKYGNETMILKVINTADSRIDNSWLQISFE